jgi:hypothetical protein
MIKERMLHGMIGAVLIVMINERMLHGMTGAVLIVDAFELQDMN